MFVGFTPVRISFSGGGTDMPEYYQKYGGNVVSTTINHFTYVIIKPRNDKKLQTFSSDFEIHQAKTDYNKLTHKPGTEIVVSAIKYLKYKHGANFLTASDVPPGSGLGASSSLTINALYTIGTLQNIKWTPKKLAESAFHLERNILHHPIGKQDGYIAAYGGLNYIKFNKHEVKVSPIKIKKSTLDELQKNLLLFFLGTTRNSSKILSKQLQLTKTMKKNTIDSLHSVKLLAEELHSSLCQSDITRFGELLDKGWQAKKKFTGNVTNNRINSLYNLAMKEGSLGGKLTGAGGGGHMLIYCEKNNQRNLISKLEKHGLKLIPFNFHFNGPKIVNISKLESK